LGRRERRIRSVRIPWLAREYKRTCSDCGHVWQVPKWAVHPPRKTLPAGRQFDSMRTAEVVTANAELGEKAAVFRQCAKCGSVHYKERAVRS